MPELPELQAAVRHSAERRYGRRRRVQRTLAPVAMLATVLTAAALVAVMRSPGPSDEREVGPAAATPIAANHDPAEPTAPGLHGTGLDAVAYGDRTLLPGAANRLSYVEGQAFTVALTNQGENDEFNVKVSVRIQPADGDAVTLTQSLPTLAAGKHGTIELALDREPPIARSLTIEVTVANVPGEPSDDDNHLRFPALFLAGPSDVPAKPETSRTPTNSDTLVKPVDVAELRETEAVRADLTSGGELARAWEVPALKGHVHLIRKPDGWCISVRPADRPTRDRARQNVHRLDHLRGPRDQDRDRLNLGVRRARP